MSKHVRINIRTVANAKAARKEKRGNRDVIVVPSATLPDNVVMNSILYPAEEIEKGFKSLERTPAPLGHPMINGEYVSAKDPLGLAQGWIGAWNENVHRKNGRVFIDKVIDVEVANQSEKGKRVLEAIEKGEPIHTSTGLFCTLDDAPKGENDYKMVARQMNFDHDAILLDVAGAATPEQGVGLFVNSDGQQEKLDVINASLEQADQELDWAVDSVARALERYQRVPMLEQLKAHVLDFFKVEKVNTITTNKKEDTMSEKDLEALAGKVDALTEEFAKLPATLAESLGTAIGNALKPLTDAHAAQVANQKAQDDAKRADLVTKVVKANMLEEAIANETPLATLEALAAKIGNGKAPAIHGAFNASVEKPAGFKLPKAEG